MEEIEQPKIKDKPTIDIFKISGLIVGTTIFIAYIKQYLYYLYFKIDISNYINIDEVLTPFIDDLSLWIVFSIFSTIGMVVLMLLLNPLFKKLPQTQTIKTDKTHKNTGYFLGIIQTILFGVVATYCIIDLMNNKQYLFWLVIIPNTVWYLFLIMVVFNANLAKKIAKRYTMTLATIIAIVFIPCMISMLIKSEILYKTEKENQDKIYIFNFNNGKQIVTDSATVYLGRTKNNIFIYNKYANKVNSKQSRIEIYDKALLVKEDIFYKR